MGRRGPAKQAITRSEKMQFRVTPEDAEKIRAAAARAKDAVTGQSMELAAWMRMVVMRAARTG